MSSNARSRSDDRAVLLEIYDGSLSTVEDADKIREDIDGEGRTANDFVIEVHGSETFFGIRLVF